MIEAVKKWLVFYGYTPIEGDDWVLEFLIEGTQNYILDYCNITVIPESLQKTVVEMTAGEFLRRKKASGSLDGFNLDAAIESIKEGDTTVSYSGVTSDEQRLDTLIASLTSVNRSHLVKYRRMAW